MQPAKTGYKAQLIVLSLVLASAEVMSSEPPVAAAEAALWEHSAITTLRTRRADEDVSLQLEQLHRAADAGRAIAQFTLGRYYYEGKWLVRDQSRGLRLIRDAARQGLAAAQAYVGWLHYIGINGVSDPDEAERWLTAAARQGDAYATGLLAELYMRRPAAGKPSDLAQRLFERGAELGDNRARNFVGRKLLYGPHATRNPKLGEYLLLRAAQTRDAYAAFVLGFEYVAGAKLKQDLKQGAYWIGEASKQEFTLATLWLCALTARGIGVPKDPEYAERLLDTTLRHASVGEKNAFAWQLAAGPDLELRNAELALRVMEPALAELDEPPAAYVDTLAAAYAAAGRFDEAVEIQERAIDLARAQARADLLREFGMRLDLYAKREAFYEVRP